MGDFFDDEPIGKHVIFTNNGEIKIKFIDYGKPYDPLAKPDPNTSLPLMERKKGGLGIFMVKKSMDDMTYEYKDGKNILTIVKNI